MNTISLLEKEEEQIQSEIEKHAQAPDDDHLPIYDGIVNVKRYLESDYKILWVLKEAYEKCDNTGGGWKIISCIANDPNKNLYTDMVKAGWRTFEPIAYISYSILHDFISWTEMDSISENPAIADSLANIAYINIGKMPATPKSQMTSIAQHYEHWKKLLHRQIQSYRPDIILFGGTFSFFKNDLFIDESEIKRSEYFPYIVRGSTVYFDIYHPSQHTIERDEYIADIINTLKKIYN